LLCEYTQEQEALEAFDRALELDPRYELALVNRKMVASLEEGQSLAGDVKSVEYYKDYPFQNRSYIFLIILLFAECTSNFDL
jgi:lipoprotein NlpI